jgi:hypothetical protein
MIFMKKQADVRWKFHDKYFSAYPTRPLQKRKAGRRLPFSICD